MLKTAITSIVMLALLTLPVSQTTIAQSKAIPAEVGTSTEQNAEAKTDLKKVIAENDKKYADKTSSVDAKEMEKIARQTPPKSGWTTKQKVWLVVGAVGLAALLFVLIKYGKECKVSDPPNCTPGVDEFCTCREYEPRN